ncbi:MAG: diguanylate cyclase [Syntrophorhabdaceae bacterium]|nr:diguanylate cyclase [Syntrophorhabdaceae bacterium]
MDEKTIFVISDDKTVLKDIRDRLDGIYRVSLFTKVEKAIDYIYHSLPDLVILHTRRKGAKSMEIINDIKLDPIFSRMPVILIIPDGMKIDWDKAFAEDYLYESSIENDLIERIKLTIVRNERVVEINPLTRLPGNISINREIQRRIDRKEIFALAYGDIDQFKPFNDKYGFSRGDEVIKATGRIVMNIVRQEEPKNGFVGHIGGDDFVYITSTELIEKISDQIITSFNNLVSIFYDKDDIERGFIISKDRQGIERHFPIMTMSIGIAHNRFIPFSHFGEATGIASKMKSLAKKSKGGCWMMDRRHT